MVTWGFSFRRNTKDVYYDGHERDDVVNYLQEWAVRMVAREKLMTSYDQADPTIEICPTVDLSLGQQQLVMVTHDECTFYANDGKQVLWLRDDEQVLRNKSPGRSMMISEFQCPCHGTMRHGNLVSSKLFFAGANNEGYWTSQDMVEQLKEQAIPIFEALHPNCQALFLFGQSSNHN